jgi:hypothetical protein
MVDPNESTAGSPESSVCEEIGRAVGSLRQRSSGERPTSVRTEFVGDVVRCTIEEKDHDGSASTSYRSQAEAAVARLTKRRVVGFVTKPGPDDATLNSFILEPVRTKY